MFYKCEDLSMAERLSTARRNIIKLWFLRQSLDAEEDRRFTQTFRSVCNGSSPGRQVPGYDKLICYCAYVLFYM